MTIIPEPARTLITSASATGRMLNRRSGMIGSSARRSWKTNRTAVRIETRIIPTMTGEPHSYLPPPHIMASSIVTTEVTSRPAPSMSIRWGTLSVMRGRTLPMA